MDFILTQRAVEVFFKIDPCNFEFSVGFGEWFINVSFFTYRWGTEITEFLGNAITIQ